jgi:hypothetical protein
MSNPLLEKRKVVMVCATTQQSILTVGTVAELSRELDLRTQSFGGVGSKSTAATFSQQKTVM